MKSDDSLLSKIRGGLYGQALGDAWGAPALTRPAHTRARYGDWLDDLVAPPADHPVHGGFAAGEITDDTQQAFALAQVLIDDGCISVEGAARAIVAWYDEIDGDHSPYVGPSTRRAVEALKQGADPRETGRHGDTNGGAMRISPIGLIHPSDPDAAIADAVVACTPSHFTDVALSGACAVAAAVAHALDDTATVESILEAGIHGAEVGVMQGQPWMGPSVARRIELAFDLASDTDFSAHERLDHLYDIIGSTLMAADAVPCAFGVFAMAAGDPVQTAIYAAALSGDADTVGAMACAMAGAWRGVAAIPAKHLETLRSANPAYDFEAVARGLYEMALAHL